ncbi:flavohemoprotein [Actinokineospora bangkokensis]|uniref:nitric oxide dioxygenase n=1 Tax=Actinokineospora bangkokensis TaxID=1193682 RepID=A0A1Q9LGN4_9PSEU|nr:flavohemoprotein [Actinokineospora bangkokensis]
MVRLVRESFALVEPRTAEVARDFHGNLFHIAPSAREMFPINMSVQRPRLLLALVRLVQLVDRPDDLLPQLRQLGREHRKFGVLSEHYEAVGTALIHAVREHSGPRWTDEVERAWAEAYTIMARAMLDAAEADDGPPLWTAEVVDHERIGWDLAVVRVLPSEPLPHRAGQYVSVEVPQRPRLWRSLSPASAPGADGVLEFHVRAVEGGWVSRSIVAHAQLGDQWRVGAPMGHLTVDRTSDRDVLMVAGGTGIAPMRAIVEDLAQWGQNPRVHLFNGGRVREDLYDLPHLRNIAATNPWLTVIPVVEHAPDEEGAEHGTLAQAIARYGSWDDCDILVAGSPAMIKATVATLRRGGAPEHRIHHDPVPWD